MARGTLLVILMISSLALAGCGTTPGCRAASTGALGAGAGAVVAAVAGAPILAGAAIGGAAGAITGAATKPKVASLGKSPFCY